MQGFIQQARPSKSGKTLSVQINNVWYTTKSPELERMVGQAITFESSVQEFPDGGSCTWLNDYTIDNAPAQPTPSGQAFDIAMQQVPAQTGPPQSPQYDQQRRIQASGQPPPMGSSQPPQAQSQAVNKDALIGALALTKSVSGSKEQVWEGFVYFYHKMENFDPTVPF